MKWKEETPLIWPDAGTHQAQPEETLPGLTARGDRLLGAVQGTLGEQWCHYTPPHLGGAVIKLIILVLCSTFSIDGIAVSIRVGVIALKLKLYSSRNIPN